MERQGSLVESIEKRMTRRQTKVSPSKAPGQDPKYSQHRAGGHE